MRLDDNPLFRKAFTPWYDSNLVCWIVLIAMVVLVLFSWAGIVVARSTPDYHGHTWVPIVLLLLSLWVGLSIIFRLVRRFVLNRMPYREP